MMLCPVQRYTSGQGQPLKYPFCRGATTMLFVQLVEFGQV